MNHYINKIKKLVDKREHDLSPFRILIAEFLLVVLVFLNRPREHLERADNKEEPGLKDLEVAFNGTKVTYLRGYQSSSRSRTKQLPRRNN